MMLKGQRLTAPKGPIELQYRHTPPGAEATRDSSEYFCSPKGRAEHPLVLRLCNFFSWTL